MKGSARNVKIDIQATICCQQAIKRHIFVAPVMHVNIPKSPTPRCPLDPDPDSGPHAEHISSPSFLDLVRVSAEPSSKAHRRISSINFGLKSDQRRLATVGSGTKSGVFLLRRQISSIYFSRDGKLHCLKEARLAQSKHTPQDCKTEPVGLLCSAFAPWPPRR